MKTILKDTKGKKNQSLASQEPVSGKRKTTTTTYYAHLETDKKKKLEPSKMSEVIIFISDLLPSTLVPFPF